MTVPELRFKKDDGTDFLEWEKKDVGSITKELDFYATLSSGYPLLTSSRSGIMLQSEYRDKMTTDSDETLFSVVPYGKCTYRHMSDDDIFHFNINTIVEKGLVSREYPVFDTIDKNNLFLLVEYLNSNRRFRKFCREMKKGGTRTRLYYKNLCEFCLMFPCLEEQQKIASFLSSVDEVIAKSEAEVAAWEKRKKGVMQKIFSQEVRFKKDDGSDYPDWEEKKFGSIIEEYRERTKIENEDTLLSCAIDGMFLNSELFSHERASSNIGYLKVYKGTLILSAQNLHLGNANVNLRFEHGIISPAYKTYRIVGCLEKYLAYWIKQDSVKRFFYNATTVGASQCRRNIEWDTLYKQKLRIPSLPEQQKIVDCLSALDDVINQCKAELEKWKLLKKGLLQQMFV